MSESRAFKDYFDRKAARTLGAQVAAATNGFDQKRFVSMATQNLAELEMMDRVRQFSDALRSCLPDDIPEALEILGCSLPPELPDCKAVTDGYLQWPLGQFVADHCVDHLEPSMDFMVELTKRFSSEFAVRPFVERYPEEVFPSLLSLCEDKNPHVRRWCSEGVRPRLPWGKRLTALIENPSPILPILERLKDDEEEYVRRSVANNLNDIAKDHRERVLTLCRRWSKNAPPQRQRLVRHGLRTLIKQGHPKALEILGFGDAHGIEAKFDIKPKTVAVGGAVKLQLALKNKGRSSAALLVDYGVHYVKATGKSSPKVFKWRTLTLAPGETVTLEKSHPFKPTTIRRLHPGHHRIDIQVNGKVIAQATCTLK